MIIEDKDIQALEDKKKDKEIAFLSEVNQLLWDVLRDKFPSKGDQIYEIFRIKKEYERKDDWATSMMDALTALPVHTQPEKNKIDTNEFNKQIVNTMIKFSELAQCYYNVPLSNIRSYIETIKINLEELFDIIQSRR